MAGVSQTSNQVCPRIGFVSTWNQECGLATYARYLLSEISSDRYVVLAEDTSRKRTRSDESNVIRCWTRPGEGHSGPGMYQSMLAAVKSSNIDILHINTHSGFFKFPEFSNFLAEVRRAGIRVVAQPHTLFTREPALQALMESTDAVIVHGEENRLEAVANGARASNVHVLAHGIHCESKLWSDQARQEARREFGLPADRAIITSFGLIQPSKGIEGLLEAVLGLKSAKIPALGLVIGRTNSDDPGSGQYLAALHDLVTSHELSHDVTFLTEFVEESRLYRYLAASDLVMMNYRSQHYEASGATSLALGAGAVVATSTAPAFQSFKDAVWHMTAGYPPALTAQVLLSNRELRETLQTNGRKYATENSWAATSRRLLDIYRDCLGGSPRISDSSSKKNSDQTGESTRQSKITELQKERVVMTNIATPKTAGRRVLMQNRDNALSNPGGDTVVMNRLADGLRKRGHHVTIDTNGSEDPKNYDLVHLFNFALPQMIRTYAERALAARVPFVVTSLYEDVPKFHIQSHAFSNLLIEYTKNGQDRAWYSANKPNLDGLPRATKFECEWVAKNAAAIFSNGAAEGDALRRDYPGLTNIVEVKLGHEIGTVEGPDRFIREYGIKDFVFCVGRLESRKNQLMLLKALEDSDLPVVFAGGGFTYQPNYAEAVARFKRRGKTIVLGRITPEMLSSAYSASRVHVLPSWYELPGLVSLEAGAHSRNIVATRRGTSSDYLGTSAFYCEPSDEDSILNATTAAYYKPFEQNTKAVTTSFTWEAAIQITESAYEGILGKRPAPTPSLFGGLDSIAKAAMTGMYDTTSEITELQDLIDKGELAAKSVEFTDAHRYLEQAEGLSPRNVRVLKARGAVYLAESNIDLATAYFERALAESPSDAKVLSGRGMCEMMRHKVEEAFPYFAKALHSEPTHLVAINQVVECAHRLKRYSEAIPLLKGFVQKKPKDMNIKFCLAGCLLQSGQIEEARIHLKEILVEEPAFKGIDDLLKKCDESEPKVSQSVPAEPVKPSMNDVSAALAKLGSAFEFRKVPPPSPAAPAPSGSNGPAFSFANPTPPAPPQGSPLADRMLMEAEEAKRADNLEEVAKRSRDVQALTGISTEQRSQAMALEAESHILQGRSGEAEPLYDKILEIDPKNSRALCGQGALAADGGNWTVAEQRFGAALNAQPDFDVALAGLAVCAMQRNDQEGAWSYFLKALKQNPENRRAILGVLQLGYPLKRYSEIESVLREYLDLHPVNLEMQYSLAGVLYAQKRWSECETEISKILLFDPVNEKALELSGMLAANGGKSVASDQLQM